MQAALFGVEGGEHEVVSEWLRHALRRHLEKRRHARGVVVRARVDPTIADAEVVVMGREHDGRQRWIGARTAADDVHAL